jgi:hypothetical protein
MQIYKNSPNCEIWGASFANFSVFRNAVLNDMYKYKKSRLFSQTNGNELQKYE